MYVPEDDPQERVKTFRSHDIFNCKNFVLKYMAFVGLLLNSGDTVFAFRLYVYKLK